MLAHKNRSKPSRKRVFEVAPSDSQLVVEVLVDLLGLAVLAEHTAEDAHAALPDELEGEPRVGGTPALAGTGVPAFPVLREKYMELCHMSHTARKKQRGKGKIRAL